MPAILQTATAVQTMAAGGTSFVAPQVAGLIALVNQKTNARQGQANYTLYALAHGRVRNDFDCEYFAADGLQRVEGLRTLAEAACSTT